MVYIPLDTYQVVSETYLSIWLILMLTTKVKLTKLPVHKKLKTRMAVSRQSDKLMKTVLQNPRLLTVYDVWPRYDWA